jgi:hypothetical protein
MNRFSLLAFGALAAVLGTTVGCDSSTPHRTLHSAAETCARLSACGQIVDVAGPFAESFGDCQFFLEAAKVLATGTGSDNRWAAAFVDCGLAASTCDEMHACSRPTPVQAAACDSTANDTCSGNVIVNCSMKGTSREVTAYDCAKAGLVCGAGADGDAMCGLAACNPASTPAVCEGDLLVTCESQGNVLSSHDCRQEGRACGTDALGKATCLGDTTCDLFTSQFRCQGSTRVWCDGGTEARADCSALGSGLTCAVKTSSDGSSTSTSMGCTPIAQECVVGASESCQDGVITYCNAGHPATFDCHSVGFSGCSTQAKGTNTIAGCVL